MQDRRPVPVGVNLAPPLRLWTLSGGAVYLPDEDAVVLPVVGATVTSPWVRTDKPGSLRWIEEWVIPAGGDNRRLLSINYADEARVIRGSNGSAGPVPVSESWSVSNYRLTAGEANGMAGTTYVRYYYSVAPTWGVAGSKLRNPQVYVTR